MNTEEILKNADNISLEASPLESDLCAAWPTVKSGLQILIQVVKNPVLKSVISSIIAAGDAIVGKICPNPKWIL